MTKGIDYAWSRPSVKSLKAGGFKFAGRYLSTADASKCITLDEAKYLSNADISIFLVFENHAKRTRDGYSAGQTDAKAALRQAKAAGMPNNRPIYFAVDYDSSGSADAPYFRGAISVLGLERVGIYGGIRSVKYMAEHELASWFWQTLAWSAGKWYDGNHVEQYAIEEVVGGADVDFNRSKKTDFGQWKVGQTFPSPKPPAPPVVAEEEEEDMPRGTLNVGEKAVTVEVISSPNKYTALALGADNGIQALPAQKVRVAQHTKEGWTVSTVTVDSAKGRTIVQLKPNVDTLSFRREDEGKAEVSWAI